MKTNLDFKIGLKLFSTNTSTIPDVQELKSKSVFDFIELYVIPGSYQNTIHHWRTINTQYTIHAPHSGHGINLAQLKRRQTNLNNFVDSKLFADALESNTIIVHGGNNGYISETIQQIERLNDHRIILENQPKIGLQNETCIGYSANNFHQIIKAGVLHGTALDFGHATYAAQSLKVDAIEIIKELMGFNPKAFHLFDGDSSSEKDIHLNLGKGNFDLRTLISIIPKGSLVTLETPKDTLEDFIDDVHFLLENLT